MRLAVKVENNEAVGDILNCDWMDESRFKEEGWRDVIVEKPEGIDHATEKWNPNQYTILDDGRVKVVMTKRAKTEEELAEQPVIE